MAAEERLDGVSVRPALGAAADCLLTAAAETDATLIALGSRGRGPLRAAVLGSVSAAVVARAPCPVLVASEAAGTGPHPGQRIVCGVEPGDDGPRVVRAARALAEALAAPLVLATVAPPPTVPGTSPVPGAVERLRELEQREAWGVLEAAAAAAGVGRGASRRVAFGRPAQALSQLAAETEAGLLVVGCRGRGLLRASLGGSVSAELAARAPCPVVVVPRGAALRHAGNRPALAPRAAA
ncbi:MAG: universal stress protein [Thermoleophilia bacterium]|nr:universal stress protein [Thermoleophilia bacterium]